MEEAVRASDASLLAAVSTLGQQASQLRERHPGETLRLCEIAMHLIARVALPTTPCLAEMARLQHLRAEALLGLGRVDEAAAATGALIREDEANGRRSADGTHYLHGRVAAARGDHAQAEAAFTRVLAARPTHAECLRLRALSRLRLGRVLQALDDLDRACGLGGGGPRDVALYREGVELLARSAQALELKGRFSDAATLWQTTIDACARLAGPPEGRALDVLYGRYLSCTLRSGDSPGEAFAVAKDPPTPVRPPTCPPKGSPRTPLSPGVHVLKEGQLQLMC